MQYNVKFIFLKMMVCIILVKVWNTSLNTQACNLRLNETIIQIILPIIILSRLIKIIILIITIDTHST